MASASPDMTGEPSISPYSHISRASAAKAIQHLDSYAFPSTSASTLSSPLKRKKVSEVEVDPISFSTVRKSSRFTNMAGLSQVHRERPRQRRREIQVADSFAGKRQAATFQPFSLPLLLTRLQTFSITAYSSKPEYCHRLDPVSLAMSGWTHDSKTERDFLTCATCRGEWKVSVASGLSQTDRELAWRELDNSVQSQHLSWCPWKLRGCHTSLYRVPVYSRMETLTDFTREARRLARCGGIEDIQVTSNITESDEKSLRQLSLESLSLNCLLLTLLGWKLKEEPPSHLAKDCIVQCDMCSRKIGLWAFIKDQPNSRPLDVAKEHKSYCPFVNGKTQSGHLRVQDEKPLNAWQQRLQVLVGATSPDSGTTKRLLLSQDEVRKMRSSDVLAKVKSMIM